MSSEDSDWEDVDPVSPDLLLGENEFYEFEIKGPLPRSWLYDDFFRPIYLEAVKKQKDTEEHARLAEEARVAKAESEEVTRRYEILLEKQRKQFAKTKLGRALKVYDTASRLGARVEEASRVFEAITPFAVGGEGAFFRKRTVSQAGLVDESDAKKYHS